MPKGRLIKAAILMSLAALSFATTSALVKIVTRDLPFLYAVAGRSFIGLLMLFGYFKIKGIPIKGHNRGLLLFRSILGFTGMSLFFFGIQKIPLSSAVILNFSAPIFVALFSVIFLKERFRLILIPLIFLAFTGAALIVSPDFSGINTAAILVFLSAITTGLAWVTVRKMSQKDTPSTIVLYYMGYSTIFSLITLILLGIFKVHGYSFGIVNHIINPKNLLTLIGIGVFATLGQIFTTNAYSLERAAVVGVFSYLTPIFAYLIGLFAFSEVPKLTSLLGGILILVTSITVLFVERTPVKKEPPVVDT